MTFGAGSASSMGDVRRSPDHGEGEGEGKASEKKFIEQGEGEGVEPPMAPQVNARITSTRGCFTLQGLCLIFSL